MEHNIFFSVIFQDYLVFTPAKKYIKYFSGSARIDSWKSNGMLEENVENITKSNNTFGQTFVDHHVLPDINFNGHSLINNIYIHKKKKVYMYIYTHIYKKFKHKFYIANWDL